MNKSTLLCIALLLAGPTAAQSQSINPTPYFNPLDEARELRKQELRSQAEFRSSLLWLLPRVQELTTEPSPTRPSMFSNKTCITTQLSRGFSTICH